MTKHFFIVGAQRCATSYLYELLDDHPEIEMARPIQPEPKFFLLDSLYERGLDFYAERFFAGRSGARVRGEKSASYIESEKCARRIAAHFPEAKIVMILRDPIERAVSNYWYSVNNGLEKLPLWEAFLSEEERREDYDHDRISASPYAYLRRGRYIEQIALYERHFPRENIRVLLHEEFIRSGGGLAELYAFLGVDPDHVASALGRIVNASEREPFEFMPEQMAYLCNYFAESNTELARRLGRSLEGWASATKLTSHATGS